MIVNSQELLKIKRDRSGVIPFTIIDNKTYFLLAKDKKTGELGDFGGGSKKNENALETAKREFEEESKGIFIGEYSDLNRYLNNVTVLNDKMAVTFLQVDMTWFYSACKTFRRQRKSKDEIYDIVWVDFETFQNLVMERVNHRKFKMWPKVSKFFQRISV